MKLYRNQTMKITTTSLMPEVRTFLKLLLLITIVFVGLSLLLKLAFFRNSGSLQTDVMWFQIIAYPLFITLGVTFGARRMRLVIEEVNDAANLKDQVVNSLLDFGLSIKNTCGDQTELQLPNGFYRTLNNWFCTEITIVKQEDDKVVVEGSARFVDFIDTKFRFGKAFREYR